MDSSETQTKRYSALPQHIRDALNGIEPSWDGDLAYFPCRVVLKDGRVGDNVYIVAEQPYIRMWGIYPEDDRGKSSIRIEDLIEVNESPIRLPAKFANQLYKAGESGMGYTIFTLVFSDGLTQACGTGNAIDFIRYPANKGPDDVVAVLPHEGRRDDSLVSMPDYTWCIYSE
jgi:hypothetical protein